MLIFKQWLKLGILLGASEMWIIVHRPTAATQEYPENYYSQLLLLQQLLYGGLPLVLFENWAIGNKMKLLDDPSFERELAGLLAFLCDRS